MSDNRRGYYPDAYSATITFARYLRARKIAVYERRECPTLSF